jgi:hypothetical protein
VAASRVDDDYGNGAACFADGAFAVAGDSDAPRGIPPRPFVVGTHQAYLAHLDEVTNCEATPSKEVRLARRRGPSRASE